MFPGTFAPWNESSRELAFPGMNVLSENFCSEERKYREQKVPEPLAPNQNLIR